MYKNFKLTESEKKDILEQHGRYGYKKPLNEQPFNSGGEPMMTQRQYNDYSEPSEPDYNDNDYYGDDDQKIVQDELKRKLEKNDILLETFDGEEFFIRCRGNNDFMIYFEGEKVKIYENGREGEKENTFNLMDAFNYIMDNRNKFHNYQESAKLRNDDFENDRRNRDYSRGEQMSENQFNEGDYQDYLDTNYSSDGMDDYNADERTKEISNKLFEIGKLLHQLGRKDEAQKYRQEAIESGRSIWNDDDWGHYD